MSLSRVLVQLGLRNEGRPTRRAFEGVSCLLRGRLHVHLRVLHQFAFGVEFCTARPTFVLPSKWSHYSTSEFEKTGSNYLGVDDQ